MSYSRELIQLIRSRPVTDEDLRAAAFYVLDAFASAYAGSRTPTGGIVLDWARASGTDGAGRQALLLGALTHITETDDLHRASVTHPGCVVVPAAFALGERLGAGAGAILRAVLHGFEAMCRVGAAVGPSHYKIWHNTATCGPFGSAMAAAGLLDLDLGQTVNALGNAGTQSSGLWQFMETSAMSKHLHAGRAAESGLLAAELAAHGFTGPPRILEGAKGLFAGMCPDPTPEAILAEPDAPWQLALTSIKPWPSCRHTHPAIDAALELHPQLGDASIDSIDIATYQAALDVCDRPQPDDEYQAKFSIYHCVAAALSDGEVGLASFTEQARQASAPLRAVTTLRAAEPFTGRYPRAWGAEVRVATAGGDVLLAFRKDCKGDPELALSEAELRAKACSLTAFGGLSESAAESFCDGVLDLPGGRQTPSIVRDYFSAVGLGDG